MTLAGKAQGSIVSGETRTYVPSSVSYTTQAPVVEKEPAAPVAPATPAAAEPKTPAARAPRTPAAAAPPTEELTPAGGDAGDTDDDQDELDAEGKPKAPAADPAEPKTPARSPEDQELYDAAFAEGRQAKETELERTQREQDESKETEAEATALKTHRETVRTNVLKPLDWISVKTLQLEDGSRVRQPVVTLEGVDYNVTPASLDAVKEAMVKELDAGYKLEAKHHGTKLQGLITDAVVKLVPEDKRAETTKALDNAGNPDELVQLIVDAAATSARPLKDAELDTVLGLSAKAKRQHVEAIRVAAREAKEAERARIYELHGIEGEPELTGGVAAGGGKRDYAWYMAMTPNDRRKFAAEHPDEEKKIIAAEERRRR